MTRRVLVVDDSFVMRAGMCSFVASLPGLSVAGEAVSGNEALEAARRLRPDVVLMDLRMPDGDGIAATRAIVAEIPEAAVLVLTWSEDARLIRDAVLAGARGVLVHGYYGSGELADALRALAEGTAPERPILRVPAEASPEDGAVELAPLTGRERQVLELVRRGLANRAIAHELGIGEKTVKNHLSSIYSKLNMHTRLEAMGALTAPRDQSSLTR